jgi:hypothetical protein
MKQVNYQKGYPYALKTETEERIVPIIFRTNVYTILRGNNNMATNANIIFGGESNALCNRYST